MMPSWTQPGRDCLSTSRPARWWASGRATAPTRPRPELSREPSPVGRRLPDPRRVAHERRGRLAEFVAAVSLICRGYRILALRHRNGLGEIDIVAVRGTRLAFVEVKNRATLADAEASLTARQTERLYAAASYWIAKRPFYRDHDRGFDTILIAPGHRPVYQRDGLQPAVMRRGRFAA